MSEADLLEYVKTQIKELSQFNDNEIKNWIDVTKDTIKNSGVKDELINSPAALGLIVQGVNDFRLRVNLLEDGTFLFLLTQLTLKGARL